jgi:hypothetical protein
MYIFVKNFIFYAYGAPHLTQIFLGGGGNGEGAKEKGLQSWAFHAMRWIDSSHGALMAYQG